MLQAWLKNTKKFFKSIESELLKIDDNELQRQFSEFQKTEKPNDIWRFACKMLTDATRDADLDKLEELQEYANKKFGKKNVSGVFSELTSNSVYFLRKTESLGRLDRDNETSAIKGAVAKSRASYETLVIRLEHEIIAPQLMKRLYRLCHSQSKLLAPKTSEAMAKREIKDYLTDNKLSSFKKFMTEYQDISALLGEQSVLSLFPSAESNEMRNQMIRLAEANLPFLEILSQNKQLPQPKTPTELLERIEIFGVLASFPYSSQNSLSEKTVDFLKTLNFAQFQLLKDAHELAKQILLDLWSESFKDASTTLPFSVLNTFAGKPLNLIFNSLFQALIHQLTDYDKREFKETLVAALSDFHTLTQQLPSNQNNRWGFFTLIPPKADPLEKYAGIIETLSDAIPKRVIEVNQEKIGKEHDNKQLFAQLPFDDCDSTPRYR